jgi:O-antigen/teichoic acid export membrane protein
MPDIMGFDFPGRVRAYYQAFRSAKWALADQIVVSGSNFLTNILLARILGIEEYGRYVLAWAVVMFVQSLQYSTISSTMLSIGPKHDAEQARSYFGAIIVHQAIFGAASSVLTVLGGYGVALAFPKLNLDGVIAPLAAAVLFAQTQDFVRRYFYTVAESHISLAIDLIRYVGQILAIAAMVRWFPATSATALWLVAGVSALSALAAIPFLPTMEYSIESIVGAALRGWHFSKWLVASTLLSSSFANVFSFAAGILLGAAAVGAMRAAFILVSVANVVIEASVNLISANASRKFMSTGRGGLIAYLERVALYGTLAIVLPLAVIVIAPRFWLHLFFGPQFASYWILVPWYAGLIVLIFLGLVIGTWYRTLESTRPIFYANIVSTIISLALAYPLIANFGVTGAVVGLLIGQFAQVSLLVLAARAT